LFLQQTIKKKKSYRTQLGGKSTYVAQGSEEDTVVMGEDGTMYVHIIIPPAGHDDGGREAMDGD
jgi:hypothetical protein